MAVRGRRLASVLSGRLVGLLGVFLVAGPIFGQANGANSLAVLVLVPVGIGPVHARVRDRTPW
jgi:hypothetical protein